ncbi:conserved hypothetical protein [Nitrosococcus watsonii C-113]|uniref:Lipocalin-like domain-containing protein n=2 Tax=Nitrosococcus TaxID=1227 RepID=D8K718_NITWC|nr:conserved hypothetical protein [Nitrosococcus watsonii C-113]
MGYHFHAYDDERSKGEYMKYKSIFSFAFLLLGCAFMSAAVYAEPVVKDRSDIAGSWALEKTSLKKDGKNGNKEVATWVFHTDGTVVISGYNKFLKKDTEFTKSYEIDEDSTIHIKDNLGTNKYRVVEKGDHEMILKGPYGYYFFEKN